MGWETTRRLRLYPRNGNLKTIDIESILKSIDSTASSMSSQIIFSVNEKIGCYEVSWNSNKFSGVVSADPTTTIIWELISIEDDSGGITLLGKSNDGEISDTNYETALFTFDEIRIIGDKTKLQHFYNEYIPNWRILNVDNKIKHGKNEVIIRLNGYYTAGNQFDLGDNDRRQKIKERINREPNNFQLNLILNETAEIFQEFIPESKFKIKELIQLTKINRKYEYSNPFKGLEKLEFYYKGRIVKSLEWHEQQNGCTNKNAATWKHKSADWWDNCVNINYLEFINHTKNRIN